MDLGNISRAAAATGTVSGADFATIQQAVLGILRDPAKNPQLALLVLSAVALLLLLLLIIVALLVTPARRRVIRRLVPVDFDSDGAPVSAEGEPVVPVSAEEAEGAGAAESPQGRPVFLALTSPLAVGLVLVAVFIATYVGTSFDAYCAGSCHAGSDMVTAATKNRHAACVSCHETPGLFGVVPNSVARLRMGLDAVVKRNTDNLDLPVDSRRCLGCHTDIRTKTVKSSIGVRMSHKEVLSGGQPCARCHPSAGHTARAYTRSMSPCIVCHDGEVASAECSTCHAKDPVSKAFAAKDSTATIGSGDVDYGGVRAANRKCDGCHDMPRQCDSCHGIRMPHSDEFKAAGHARAAAFDLKVGCFKCHAMADCGQCHSAPFDPKEGEGGHYVGWKADHKRSAWDSGCACHMGRSTRKGPICQRCHDMKSHALLPITQ